MKHYLTKLSQLALAATFFTAKSTFAYAALPNNVQIFGASRSKSSLVNDSFGEDAIAHLQNETIESHVPQSLNNAH